ncbi:Mhf1 [Kluyveromyces lactis]|nr:Mhf1 [Kluyveromyces lactis]
MDEEKRLRSQLRGKLWFYVESIIKRELPEDVKYTSKYVNTLTELVYQQICEVGGDLEAFAQHANRNVVTSEDMLLRTRKNKDLQDFLKLRLMELRDANVGRQSKR